MSAEAMLARLQVKVYPEDKVYVFPNPALGIGSQIQVYRAQPVLIVDGKHERLVRTWAKNVEELLAEQHVDLVDKDLVEPARSASLKPQDRTITVNITRVAESELKATEPIDFKTKTIEYPNLERGKEEVSQAGKKGVLTRYFLVRREDGAEVSRKETKKEVTREPVEKIVTKGTKVVQYGSGRASWYATDSMTAAHRTLPFGTKVRVTNTGSGKSVVVTIADRGPFIDGRIIDLSKDAFAAIAPLGAGTAPVVVEKE